MYWRDHPDLDRQLLASVEEGLKAGRSRNSCFNEFAKRASTQLGFTLSPKACEVRYMRLTGQISSRPHPQKRGEEGHTPRSSTWQEGAILKVASMVGAGSTVRAACAKVAVEVRRKARTVRNAYEEWKREQGKSGAPVSMGAPVSPSGTVTPPFGMLKAADVRNEEDILLETIGKLLEYGPRIPGFDLAEFAKGLGALVRSAALPVEASEQAEQVTVLREQLSRLQQQLTVAQASEEKLRQENNALQSEIHEVRREYARHYKEMVERWQEVEEVCSVHLSQSLGERVSVMRPFGERLRYTVDRFGVVIASAPEGLQKP